MSPSGRLLERSIFFSFITAIAKGLIDLPPFEMDYLITMGCEETCPAVPAKKRIEWEIPDPKGKSIDVFREIRNIIEEKVKVLLLEID